MDQEFFSALKALKIQGTGADFQALYKSVASQPAGIDYNDFVHHFAPGGAGVLLEVRAKLRPKDNMLAAAFAQFDKNSDSIISRYKLSIKAWRMHHSNTRA